MCQIYMCSMVTILMFCQKKGYWSDSSCKHIQLPRGPDYKHADYKSLRSLLVLFLLQAHLSAMKVQHLNMLTLKSQQIEPRVPIK